MARTHAKVDLNLWLDIVWLLGYGEVSAFEEGTQAHSRLESVKDRIRLMEYEHD